MEFVIVIIVIISSMVLHELAHGMVAYKLGDTTAKDDGRLTLNPLKHLDPVMSLALPLLMYLTGGVVFGGAKPVPVNPGKLRGGKWGMAAVAIAGPATNFLIALAAFLLGYYFEVSGLVEIILREYVVINLGFMVFNLIPIPPLDGSRVIYPIMPDFVQRWMDGMERFGVMVIYILLIVAGGFFSWVMNGAVMGVYQFFLNLVGAI